MEWVETTGRTIEEAKDAALDQLGVDESDAEFEVLEEPKSGLFGRLRSEARVRARVRPTRPRPKLERRDRRRSARGRDGADTRERTPGDERPAAKAERDRDGDGDGDGDRPRRRRGRSGGGGGRGGGGREDRTESRPRAADEEASTVDDGETMTLEEQGEAIRTFVDGLVEAFGASGTSSVAVLDEDNVEVRVEGADLGLLIGPKGQTLQAVQELARTVVQRSGTSRTGRVHLDIGGYRAKRREALESFTRQLADQVKASGTAKALEPMSPADRKVVHDTINDIEGVRTESRGEEPRRRVVIVPAD